MTPSPERNAAAAALYIATLVTVINAMGSIAGPKETIAIPMAALGLLVLSVALMAYLFFLEPLRLIFKEGRIEDGIRFFGKTVGIFACFVLIAVSTVLFLSYR